MLMNKKCIFSIITVSFNSEKTIETTINSVLAQTYTEYEYIIVDGASKDSTIDIIRQYEHLFEGRMQWISEADKGIYDAMNKGLKMAKGNIIGIVNSDDWLETDALSRVYDRFIEENMCEDCLYCGGIRFHQDRKVKEMMVNLKSFYKQAPLYIMSGVRHPATFVPKKVYDKIGIFNADMKLSADQDFILRCYFGGIRLVMVENILSNMAAGGLSTCGDERARKYSCDDRKLMLKRFGKKGIEYYWLYYSWRIRGIIKRFIINFGLYK